VKKHIKFALIIFLTVIATSLITAYYAAKNTRAGFLAVSLDMEAFNELHRIRSWDSLEHLLIKGCNKEALEYVQMEQALHLLSLQRMLQNGAKLDESEKVENPSIISRANTIVNKGKYYIPSCY
jgi:hypothetical protein